MTDTIYDKYLNDPKERDAILQEIKAIVISAGLENHRGVTVRNEQNTRMIDGQDSIEMCADAYARRMAGNPELAKKIKYDVRLSELADSDYKGFLTDDKNEGVLNLRASRIIRGIFVVVQGKVERREKHEKRIRAGYI